MEMVSQCEKGEKLNYNQTNTKEDREIEQY